MEILETIRTRRSVRNFDGRDLTPRDQALLLELAARVPNPYNQAISYSLLDGREHGLSSPVITGTDLWLAGKLFRAQHAEEAFGFSFESLLLQAEAELGIGAVWIAGTMNRSAFEAAMNLKQGEVMPCVSPVGYPAARMSLRETVMRKGIKADERLPFETLFFNASFSAPLDRETAGELEPLLEAVHRAPSAVNRQPWRAVVCGSTVHFYEQHSKGYIDDSGWDLQKIDLGIALCHFALAAEAFGTRALFSLDDPGFPCPNGVDYIASYIIS